MNKIFAHGVAFIFPLRKSLFSSLVFAAVLLSGVGCDSYGDKHSIVFSSTLPRHCDKPVEIVLNRSAGWSVACNYLIECNNAKKEFLEGVKTCNGESLPGGISFDAMVGRLNTLSLGGKEKFLQNEKSRIRCEIKINIGQEDEAECVLFFEGRDQLRSALEEAGLKDALVCMVEPANKQVLKEYCTKTSFYWFQYLFYKSDEILYDTLVFPE